MPRRTLASFLTLCLLVFTAPLQAQNLRERFDTSLAQLEAARATVVAAQDKKARVLALSQSVKTFENALMGLREGLRRLKRAQLRLKNDLVSKEAKTTTLLAALIETERGGSFVSLLHPDGPLGTARAGMMLSDISPAIKSQVTRLRQDLSRIEEVEKLQKVASESLQIGLVELQEARKELSRAISDRAPLPKKFTADPVQTAVLIAASETLNAFARGLDILPMEEFDRAAFEAIEPGALPWPVDGRVLVAFSSKAEDGAPLPGLRLATYAEALVFAPATSTMRYVGPLLDYGLVLILEPQENVLIVLAGLTQAFVETGDIVAAGAVLGAMGGEFSQSLLSEGAGVGLSETLYIEIRQDDLAVDPVAWFRPL